MSGIPPEELKKIEEWKKKLSSIKSKRSSDVTFAASRLLKSGKYEPFEVRLSNSAPGVDATEEYEKGYYGPHLGRTWSVGEVAAIQGNPIFNRIQKALMPIITTKPDGTQVATPNPEAVKVTPEDYQLFAEFKADMIQRTLEPSMGITKDMILNDALYMNFHWLRLMEESGLGGNMEKDLRNFFRGRESIRFAIPDNRKAGNE